MSATVVDISKGGLRLEMETMIARGTRLEVMITKPRSLVVLGDVRYCRRVGELFHAGVLMENLIFLPAEAHEHLDEDQSVLYLAGEGLTSPELVRLQQHLTRCKQCVSKLEVVGRGMSSNLRRFSPPVRWRPAE
jgi:PilZ domain